MQYPLRARCKMFHRRFPDKFISYSRLRKVYNDFGVSHRVLKPEMMLQKNQLDKQRKERLDTWPRLVQMIENQENLLFVDEAVYSSTQIA